MVNWDERGTKNHIVQEAWWFRDLFIKIDSFFWLEADIAQAIIAPVATKTKGVYFSHRWIIIISCFKGATQAIREPEITDIDAKISIGDVRELLSSR